MQSKFKGPKSKVAESLIPFSLGPWTLDLGRIA